MTEAREVVKGLRWELQRDGENEYAYSGSLVMGIVVHQSVDEKLWVYKLDGVYAKWVGKTYGRVKTKSSAKRAIERAWAAWLDAAGLASNTL